jgi:hypothetical protein
VTFLLTKDTADGYKVGPSRAITSYSGGIGASFQKAALENNANFRLQRETIARRDEVARTAARALGQGPMRRLVDEQNAKAKAMGLNSKIIEPSNDPAEMAYALGPNGSKAILDLARQEVANNPSAFRGIDFTEEGIDKFVAEKLQAEHQDAVDALEMMPSGRFSAELIGSMAGMTADVKNAPFLFLGGGSGSILKVFAREAMLNATAEAAFIPDQFKMADVLDIPEPDVLNNLLLAAGAGGALGVGFEVLGRGFRYALTMGRKPTPVGADPMTFEAAVGEAETALMQGDDPLAAAVKVLDTTPREPLIPDTPPGVPVVTTRTIPDDIAAAQEALGMARAADVKDSRPLSALIKRTAPPNKRQVAKAAREGRTLRTRTDLRIDPNGPLGQELKARGVNAKTSPGIWKTGGRGDLDNLVAREMEDEFPGIMEATGTPYDATYLDYNGFRELLIRDAQGDSSWLRSRADVMRAESDALDAENPNRAVAEMGPQDDGAFINLDEMAFGGDVESGVGRAVDGFLERKGVTGLSPDEVAAIKAKLTRDGGDVGYEIERAFERDMFDSPLSPKAMDANNARVVELRQMVEADGNFPLGETGEDGLWRGMTADDGRQINTLADALDEIDEMDALAREVELCRVGKVPF